MKANLKKLIAWILVLMLVSADVCAIAEELATLVLPAALKIIEAEAFYGDTSIEKIVVPDGTTEIRARAFADSSLSQIHLPTSIEYIADDVFDRCGTVDITAEIGSYAYEWALMNGYQPDNVVLESAHPYANNSDKTWIYTHDDTVFALKITFSSKTYFENGYDTLTITDAEGNETIYSGTKLSGTSILLKGNTFTLNLKSDSSSRYFGFRIVDIEALSEEDYLRYEDFTINMLSDGTFSIEGYVGTDTELEIPSEIFGIPVTAIGSSAFYNSNNVTSIIVPDSVTTIGHYAFYNCSNLISIVIPNGVTEINSHAFYNCSSLTNIVIPNSTTTIGSCTFQNCSSLTNIVLPDGITEIRDYTFHNCNNLTNIVLPDGIAAIGDYAFYGCNSLTNINLPDSIEYIGDNPLPDNDDLNVIVSENSYAYEWAVAMGYIESLQVSNVDDFEYTLENNAITITGYIGSETEIVIPSKIDSYPVTAIGDNAFYENTILTSISIPHSVTTIGDYAFYNCCYLENINLGNGITCIGNHAFHFAAYFSSSGNITIPDSVISIGDYAFYNCKGFVNANIGNCVTSIGDYAFSHSNIVNLTIPDSVTSIGSYAFDYCQNLVSAYIGDGVANIGERAFRYCTSLESVYIGDSVTNIGSFAFNNCKKISSIRLPDSLITIGECAFSLCENLPSIIIPDNVISIEESAFSNCSNLSNVYIGNGLTSIGEDAFISCNNLSTLIIPKNVVTIGKAAFAYCGMKKIIYSSNVAYIEENTFIISANVTHIERSTFVNCDLLTEVYIGNNITSIGDGAFGYCNNLIDVTISPSVTSIDTAAFSPRYEDAVFHVVADSYADTFLQSKSDVVISYDNLGLNAEETEFYDSLVIKALAQGYLPSPLLVLNNEMAEKIDAVNAYSFFADHPIKSILLSTGETIMIPSAAESLDAEYQNYYEEAALVTLYYLCNGHLTEAEQLLDALQDWKELIDATDFCGALVSAMQFNTSGSIKLSELVENNTYSGFPEKIQKILSNEAIGFDPKAIMSYIEPGVDASTSSLGKAIVKSFDQILDAIIANTYRNAILQSLEEDMENLLVNGGDDKKYNEIFSNVITDIKDSRINHFNDCTLNVFENTVDGVTTPTVTIFAKAVIDTTSGEYVLSAVGDALGECTVNFLTDVWLPGKAVKIGFNIGTTTVDAFLIDTDEIGLQMRNFALSYTTLNNALTNLKETISQTPDNASVYQLRELYKAYMLYYRTVSSSISVGYKLIETIHSKWVSHLINGGDEAIEGWVSVLAKARTTLCTNYSNVVIWYAYNCPEAMT